MADKAPTPPPRIETEVVTGDPSVTATMGTEPSAITKVNQSNSVEMNMGDDLPLEEGEEQDPAASEEDPENPEADPKDEPAEEDDLGEWKDDPETLEKFDARYFKEGKLDQATLSKEFWSNYAKAEDKSTVSLNEATLGYLNDRMGLDKGFVKEVCDSLVAKQASTEEGLYATVGGKESFEAMVKWGKEGGYTPAQRERFNKALKAGGADLEDALAALSARYTKANPDAAKTSAPPRAPRKSVPARNATASAGAGASGATGDTFKSHAEYSKVWGEALAAQKAADNPEAKREARANLDKLRAKARRSRFQ
jgi:hypothetical protein